MPFAHLRTGLLIMLVLVGQAVSVPVARGVALGEVRVTFASNTVLEGQNVRLYAHLSGATRDARGVVRFFDGNRQIGPDQPFSVLKGKSADVFTDYPTLPYGERTLEARFVVWNADDGPRGRATLFVDRDSDRDGTPDRADDDDDGDGTPDTKDAFPLNPAEDTDTDLDRVGNRSDPDDDGDGLLDEREANVGTDPLVADTDGDGTLDGADAFPLDPRESRDTDGDGTADNADGDDDGDGIADDQDGMPLDPRESRDTDGDGVGDNADPDADGDGSGNALERERGSDPLVADTDGDGTLDGADALPLDPREQADADNDGLGDNADPRDDNRGPIIATTIPTRGIPFVPFRLSAAGTSDPDGTITGISWFINGRPLSTATPLVILFRPGRHDILLVVSDDAGESRVARTTMTVSVIPYLATILVATLMVGSSSIWKRQ